MKMKKLVAMLLVLAMTVAVCGMTAYADDKTTVSVIAAQYGTKTADWWKDFEAKFEEAHSDIDLVVDVISWNDIKTVVDTRIANGEQPDLLNIDLFAAYQNEDLLLPAQEWVSEETYAKFYKSFLAESEVDGTVWAVPDLASARAMYVNTDILEAAGVEIPTTWAELKTACEAIKAYNPDIYPWGVDMTTDEGQACFAYYTWNNGGGFVDAEGNWALNSPENVEAVEFVVDLIKSGLTNSDPTTETRYDLQDLFAAGKLAMMIAPTQIESVCAEAGNNVNFKATLIPCNEGKSNASMGVMDRIMCFDNGYTEEELAAITTVVDAFYDDQPYADWVLMENFIPATIQGGELCIQADPAMEDWINLVAGAQFYPASKPEWDDVKVGVIDAQQRILLGENAQEVLDELQTEIAG